MGVKLVGRAGLAYRLISNIEARPVPKSPVAPDFPTIDQFRAGFPTTAPILTPIPPPAVPNNPLETLRVRSPVRNRLAPTYRV
jgi:hypothetical protein